MKNPTNTNASAGHLTQNSVSNYTRTKVKSAGTAELKEARLRLSQQIDKLEVAIEQFIIATVGGCHHV